MKKSEQIDYTRIVDICCAYVLRVQEWNGEFTTTDRDKLYQIIRKDLDGEE
jgi:hypothetical protein